MMQKGINDSLETNDAYQCISTTVKLKIERSVQIKIVTS